MLKRVCAPSRKIMFQSIRQSRRPASRRRRLSPRALAPFGSPLSLFLSLTPPPHRPVSIASTVHARKLRMSHISRSIAPRSQSLVILPSTRVVVAPSPSRVPRVPRAARPASTYRAHIFPTAPVSSIASRAPSPSSGRSPVIAPRSRRRADDGWMRRHASECIARDSDRRDARRRAVAESSRPIVFFYSLDVPVCVARGACERCGSCVRDATV